MKANDDRAKWQIQKPVDERASFPLTPEEDEELRQAFGCRMCEEPMTPNRIVATTSTDLPIRSSL